MLFFEQQARRQPRSLPQYSELVLYLTAALAMQTKARQPAWPLLVVLLDDSVHRIICCAAVFAACGKLEELRLR